MPLVGSVPQQEEKAEASLHDKEAASLPLRPDEIPPAGERHLSEALPPANEHGTEAGTSEAASSTEEVASLGGVPKESPVTLQLFIVSHEGDDANSAPAPGSTLRSKEQRRSSGVRRTLLAQLQVLAIPTQLPTPCCRVNPDPE